ncbi:MAG: hypothetical protein JRD89_10905 [Deltaproteobacteria bacterium]|nr:hypothetical protein [Deltaproteobacteria bacterium]
MKKPGRCKICGKESDDISWHGLCPDCSANRWLDAYRQLQEKHGPVYAKWKTGVLRSLKSKGRKKRAERK